MTSSRIIRIGIALAVALGIFVFHLVTDKSPTPAMGAWATKYANPDAQALRNVGGELAHVNNNTTTAQALQICQQGAAVVKTAQSHPAPPNASFAILYAQFLGSNSSVFSDCQKLLVTGNVKFEGDMKRQMDQATTLDTRLMNMARNMGFTITHP